MINARVLSRQWLAEAILELLLYRDEAPEVALAIGLPAGFEDGHVWEE